MGGAPLLKTRREYRANKMLREKKKKKKKKGKETYGRATAVYHVSRYANPTWKSCFRVKVSLPSVSFVLL